MTKAATMKASVMTSPGNILIHDVERPTPSRGEILVQIKHIGICGSDIHVFHGRHPYTSYPIVQGHEVSGVIAEVGEGVTHLGPAYTAADRVSQIAASTAASGAQVGIPVTIRPQLVCGRCYPCRHGQYEVCDELRVMGFQAPGAAAEYFAAPAETIVALAADLALDLGAMIEPLAVAVHAVRRASAPVAGCKVVVIGAGTIGNLVCQTAKALGAVGVLAVDLSAYRLDLVASLGADHIWQAETDNSLATRVVDLFGTDKADLILECVGTEVTVNEAIRAARKGSEIILVGVVPGLPAVDMGLLQDRQLTIRGSLMYRHEDFIEAIDLVVSRRVDLAPLISARFPFDRYADAYEYADANREKALKVMVDLQADR